MVKKKVLAPERIRQIRGGFSFIPHRFLTAGFLAALGHNELLLYFFLVLVSDRQGFSFYSYDAICSLLELTLDEYLEARDGLICKDLIAFDGTLFQVLELPDRICKKYLQNALPQKRLAHLHPVHSFRHSRAVDMLREGKSVTDIRNHFGHDNVQSTMVCLHLDPQRRRDIQRRFLRHMEALLKEDPKINELLGWENDQDLMRWLDTL